MIFGGEFVAGIDLVDVSLWLFTLFFVGLIFYLRKEDRREGYPLESDTTGRHEPSGVFWMPKKKSYNLPHGRGELTMASGPRDERDHAIRRTAVWPGAPYVPTGDPMQDGVGPASYANRQDVPDLTMEGLPRIAPYRASPGYEVAKQDQDPRGLDIVGLDKVVAGKVVDLWVDRSEAMIRYLEVEVPVAAVAVVTESRPVGEDPVAAAAVVGTTRVLVPMPFVKVHGGLNPKVTVEAVTAEQLQAAPRTAEELTVTRLEEDRISGYFGGGKLYATAARSEPWL
ncbi:MAG: photosynthetic reaction center subunit H [Henriciella sp.]|uniref:photosynthetic reaction center subunit H n=1 Tax=Henriciella sp. TaxID=1968823 RepID=UPI003C747D42